LSSIYGTNLPSGKMRFYFQILQVRLITSGHMDDNDTKKGRNINRKINTWSRIRLLLIIVMRQIAAVLEKLLLNYRWMKDTFQIK
jgi:hypothetical protein